MHANLHLSPSEPAASALKEEGFSNVLGTIRSDGEQLCVETFVRLPVDVALPELLAVHNSQ